MDNAAFVFGVLFYKAHRVIMKNQNYVKMRLLLHCADKSKKKCLFEAFVELTEYGE